MRSRSVTNIILLLLSIVVCWELGQRTFAAWALSPRGKILGPGDVLNLTGLAERREPSLVFVLSTACAYCRHQMGFYRSLEMATSNGAAAGTLLMPEGLAQDRAYTSAGNLTVSDLRAVDLRKLGIHSVPELLILEPGGRVRNRWVGALGFAEQQSVFRELGRAEAEAGPMQHRPADVSSAASIATSMRSGGLIVLDIRNRDKFNLGHIAGALNIPYDELWTRASHEVGGRHPVAIYCYYCSECESGKRSAGITTVCTDAEAMLRSLGYRDATIIGAKLADLKAIGAPIIGSDRELP